MLDGERLSKILVLTIAWAVELEPIIRPFGQWMKQGNGSVMGEGEVR
jgi:hypothetical protein